MTACAEHRAFLAAIADGEVSAVPTATLDHLRSCPECAHELELQRVLGSKLQEALEGPAAEPVRGITRGRAGAAVASLAAVMVLAAGGVVAFNLTRPDPVLAAARASQQPAQFSSGDGSQIGAWCVQESGRPMPEMDLPPLEPVGARMDRQAGAGIVTVYYVSPEGQPVTVSWLDATTAPATSRTVSSRLVAGRLVLVARSPHGTAVISGQSPASLLWSTAAEVEDGS